MIIPIGLKNACTWQIFCYQILKSDFGLKVKVYMDVVTGGRDCPINTNKHTLQLKVPLDLFY
jgi:hypothetical protein